MIESLNLTKYYNQKCVVDDISFEVKPGEVLGFLGPNGAGKSTTMKMITGFLNPTSGTARINGIDVLENPTKARERLGYLPENGPLYEEMTVEEFLRFISGIRNKNQSKIEQLALVEIALRTCHLEDVRSQTIDTLSKGFHQRVGVAQAIIHDPDYLILDEPTDGLDPNQKNEIRALLKQMSASKSIILSTHILEEVEAICSRVIIIANGRLVVDESPEVLRRRHPDFGAVEVTFHQQDVPASIFEQRFPSFKVEKADRSLVIRPKSGENVISEIHHLIVEKSIDVQAVNPMKTPLDRVFRDLTASKLS